MDHASHETVVESVDGSMQPATVEPVAPHGPVSTEIRLSALRRMEARINSERRSLDAAAYDVAAEIATLEGNQDAADWRRLQAKSFRSGDLDDHLAAHQAWVRMMARDVMRSGRPYVESSAQGEVEAEIERLRAEGQ